MAQSIEIKIDEIPIGTMKPFTIGDKEVLVVNYSGKFYAIGNRCTHVGGDLSKGKLEENIVTCPRHGSKFDITTGNRIAGPAKQNEPTYQVEVKDSNLKVNI
jgi:nitrite reductase/ring-hydroxylating ferredoxin subunit